MRLREFPAFSACDARSNSAVFLMGLLLSHICTLSVYPDMVRLEGPTLPAKSEPAERGEIAGFSRASRKRLIELMHQLEYKTVHFLTLTYPACFPTSGLVFKAHLRAWRERFQRKYGKLRVIWRLEFQERGAPHFHLLVMDAPFLDKEWLSRSWYEVVGSGDERHLKAGTNIKLVTDAKQCKLVMSYVGKYIGKIDQSTAPKEVEHVGRYWGCWNVKTRPSATVSITAATAYHLVTMLASLSVDAKPFVPSDPIRCAIYGSSPGCGDFANRVMRTLAEITSAGVRGRARIDIPIRVNGWG